VLGGGFGRGEARFGRLAAVGHGCAPALFRGFSTLTTTQEAGR
jgi:TldD protein